MVKSGESVEVVVTASSNTSDAGAAIWLLPTFTQVGTLRGCTPPSNGLAVLRRTRGLPQGTSGFALAASETSSASGVHVLATHSQKPSLQCWHPRREQPVARSFPPDRSRALCTSPCGELVAAGSSRSGAVFCWDVASGAQIAAWEAHAAPVTGTAFARGGAELMTSSADGTVRVWTPAGVPLATVACHGMGVEAMAVAMQGCASGRSRFVTVSSDRECKGWDLDTMSCLFHLTLPCALVSVCVDETWTVAFLGGRDGEVFRIDLTEASVTGDTDPVVLSGHTGAVRSVCLSSDGSMLFSGSDDETTRVWDASTGQHLRTLKNHSGPVTCVAAITLDKTLLDKDERDVDKGLWQPLPLQKFQGSNNGNSN